MDNAGQILIVGVILLATLPFVYPSGLLWVAVTWGTMGLIMWGVSLTRQRR